MAQKTNFSKILEKSLAFHIMDIWTYLQMKNLLLKPDYLSHDQKKKLK